MKRSSHIAVKVPADQVEAAATHYKSLLGVRETDRKPGFVELSGENFTLYVEEGESPVVLQEFVTDGGAELRARFEAAGCRIFDESEMGFHVADPFGLCYHVFTAQGAATPPAG